MSWSKDRSSGSETNKIPSEIVMELTIWRVEYLFPNMYPTSMVMAVLPERKTICIGMLMLNFHTKLFISDVEKYIITIKNHFEGGTLGAR